MAHALTITTSRASLDALGEPLRRQCCFAPLREPVQSLQKTVLYRPTDKRLDGVLGLLGGAKTLAQSQGPMRVDPAVQRAFGRTGCADQSTIAHTPQACPVEPGAQLEGVSWDSLKRSGRPPRPRFAAQLLGVAVDVTPRPIGARAAGRERTGMGRQRRKTGRKTLRWTASAYREILQETLLRGKASAGPALHTALGALETHWG